MQRTIIIDTDIDITKDEEFTILESIGNMIASNSNRKNVHVWFDEDDDSIPAEITGGGCFTQPPYDPTQIF